MHRLAHEPRVSTAHAGGQVGAARPPRPTLSQYPNMITKAVIPAAGFGTRFLPATKASPKEMLPINRRMTVVTGTSS